METQNVECDEEGRFTVLLGATTREGLPPHLFAENEARWLGVWVQLPDEVEQARLPLTSVNYALKSADADRLGGRPASDYLLRESAGSKNSDSSGGGLSSRILWPGGQITGVLAGAGLIGGGTWGNVTLELDTTYTDARYAQLNGTNLLQGDLTISGNLSLLGQLNDSFFVGTTGGFVTPPSTGPLVGIESESGGTIANGTYYFTTTMVNLNGETPPSPVTAVTLTTCQGTGCVVKVVLRGWEWQTGAFGYRVYASVDGANFHLQAARPLQLSISPAMIQRQGNIVTIHSHMQSTGFTVGDRVSVLGAAGCSFSPDGTFQIIQTTAVGSPAASSFKYQQQGPDETCGGGVASVRTDFDLGSMTNIHLVRGDFLVSGLQHLGPAPPTANTAAIDDVQVAVNKACNFAGRHCDGVVVLGDGNDSTPTGMQYNLTTPLIVSTGATIRGQTADVVLGMRQGTQVSCTPATNPLWGSEDVGCIMIINAQGAQIQGVNVVSHSHGVMLFHSNTDAAASNHIEVSNATLHTRGTSSVAPLRIKGRFYYLKLERLILVANSTRDTAPVRSAAVMLSNTAGGDWHWFGPVRWMVPTKHDGLQHRKGPTDPDRGMNVPGFPAMANVSLHNIQIQFTGGGGTGVPCRCENTNLKLDNVNWADYWPDPGTDALIQLGLDRDAQGSSHGFQINNSGLGGSPNAVATIQLVNPSNPIRITDSGVFGSGPSSIAIDANGMQTKIVINGGSGTNCDPLATSHIVANALTRITSQVSCVNTGNTDTATARRTQHVFMGGILFRGHTPNSLEWLHWQDNTSNLDWWRGSPGWLANRRATFGSGFTRFYQSDGVTPLADFDRVTNQVSLFSVQPVVGGGLLGSPSLRWSGTFSTIDLNGTLTSTLPVGTPPLTVASTTEVANLNVQKWHGRDAIDFSEVADFGTIPALSCSEIHLNVPGALVGSPVAVAWPMLDLSLTGLMLVSAPGTVTIRLCNLSAQPVDPPSQKFAGRIIS